MYSCWASDLGTAEKEDDDQQLGRSLRKLRPVAWAGSAPVNARSLAWTRRARLFVCKIVRLWLLLSALDNNILPIQTSLEDSESMCGGRITRSPAVCLGFSAMKYGGFTFTYISISLGVHSYANVFVSLFCGGWWLVTAIFLCSLSFETGLSLNPESA